MNAVLRLNLIVSLMFFIALAITISMMLEQASKDINREVLTSVSFNHRLLTAASNDEAFIQDLLHNHTRHVTIDLIEPNELMNKGPGSDSDNKTDLGEEESEVPEWFLDLIPGIEELEEKQYFRYLENGKVLRLQADSADEVEEVWESVQHIFILFILSALLSNIAIYAGIRHGIKPIAHFLAALGAIQKGHFTARLKQYSIREINELSKHFNMMAQALEASEEDNKKLTHELMKIQETERAHLARELHDDLGQYLTGIQAQAYLVSQSADKPEIVEAVSKQISENCVAMQTSFRQLIRDLHPVILEQLGLAEAVHAMVDSWSQQNGIDVQLNISSDIPKLDDEGNTHIYRIVQEALHNISRHSGADLVSINIDGVEGRLEMSISDNGKGIAEDAPSGMGLRSMKERARCLRGQLQLEEPEGGGCRISLELPSVTGVNV
ncbi:MAG: histidine kinase [Neptuniibacter sp.]